ncbi:MAG TPA: hypothetical protein VN691_03075 [Steroidobacteraceae bacterium]|nr:hypothetical protein [Steroidobacteraceae bacterium]
MNRPPSKISRLSELPREIPPPHDGWPALEAKLRESGRPQSGEGTGQGSAEGAMRRRRPNLASIAALAAVLAAVVVGVSIDRWILSPGRPAPQGVTAPDIEPTSGRLAVAYISDPRFLREREALLRSLNGRLAKLPPPTRQKVLQSLATIHQSMQQIQQALGKEPGNALLQELLIDTYQNEMQVLSTVQAASGGTGET